MTAAVILAAGTSQRFGRNKLLEQIELCQVWRRSYDAFASHPEIDAVALVGGDDVLQAAAESGLPFLFLKSGGSTRQESSRIGVEALSPEYETVLIHDGARPFVTHEVISAVLAGVRESRAAFPATPVTDTIREVDGERMRTLDRSKLAAVQTPQGGLREDLLRAHRECAQPVTDDMALLEHIGIRPVAVKGDPQNIKITYLEDLPVQQMETRTGLGYDIHRFSDDPSRPMWLGGVEFDDRPGLEGHSDADALLHAVVDAVLGGACLGDIGQLFPNTDPRWKNAPSIGFLTEAGRLAAEQGWRVTHLDCSVAAERPKIMKRAVDIREVIAASLGIQAGQVSIKATTNEGLGAIGRGEGIAAFAVATMVRKTT